MPYTYVFAIGTCFAMLDAYNNGANDVANAWATSVSSRSISYRQAMVFGTIFELLGAITVGARTADTIKNGIIPNAAFEGNVGVQMLAFTCALAAASSWVMWCTKHSAHVSSTYSLISAVAGVGVAVAGADKVQWGWNNGKGLGAIFAGLGMAPAISAGFGATIFLLIKFIVHLRKNPIPWAVWTAPFWFLIAGTICTLSIVYKGSPNLGLNKKPGSFVAGVTMGTGAAVALLAALFFVPFLHARIVKRDASVKWYMFVMGPLLFRRPAPQDSELSVVPNYAVVQHDEDEVTTDSRSSETDVPISKQVVENEKAFGQIAQEVSGKVLSNKELNELSEKRLNEKLMKGTGPLAWALRTLRDNPMGPGQVYELHNLKLVAKRIPAYVVCGALYGLHYDIHAAQSGTAGTPEGARMARVYAHAEKYSNEVEHSYSFVQVLTACTASFAHGANDIGNSVGPWAVIYSGWSTGNAAAAKAPVPVWQLAVLALMISLGLVTYGYNIMKGKQLSSPILTRRAFTNNLHSHGQQDHLPLAFSRLQHGNGRRHHCPRFLAVLPPRLDLHVHYRSHSRCWPLQRYPQGCQLAAYRPPRNGLDHDHSHRRHNWRSHDGALPECPPLCIEADREVSCMDG
jgi:sodium-dependent phosphate transporter